MTPYKRNKYNAKRVEADGYVFDSKLEAARYFDLIILEKVGEIQDLCIHPKYKLEVNGVLIGRYTADFEYMQDGKLVVEDVKGVRTRDFVLRKKLMLALHGIDVKEVK